jgi:hypothetical protein
MRILAGRKPWNEYECGSYCARAMASYALLGTLGLPLFRRGKDPVVRAETGEASVYRLLLDRLRARRRLTRSKTPHGARPRGTTRDRPHRADLGGGRDLKIETKTIVKPAQPGSFNFPSTTAKKKSSIIS